MFQLSKNIWAQFRAVSKLFLSQNSFFRLFSISPIQIYSFFKVSKWLNSRSYSPSKIWELSMFPYDSHPGSSLWLYDFHQLVSLLCYSLVMLMVARWVQFNELVIYQTQSQFLASQHSQSGNESTGCDVYRLDSYS